MPELNERDTRLAAWLNEAYAKEAELEADLTAHIALTKKPPYKKRLRDHLKETRQHKRLVARRIKALGSQAVAGPEIPLAPAVASEAAGKAVAAVKGQIGAVRALVTEDVETHLRNAQEELREEHVEIALYTRIQTFAEAVGDRETATLAKTILREEERMAKYLSAEVQRLVKELVRSDVPAAQRRTRAPARTSGTSAANKSSRAAAKKSSTAPARKRSTTAAAKKSSTAAARKASRG